MKSQSRKLASGLLWISPWLVGFLLLVVYPFVASLYLSFCRYDLLTEPRWVGTANYERIGGELFTGREFGEALQNTLYYAAIVIPGSIVLGVGLAVLLHVRVRGQAIYRTIFFLPSIVPTVATSILWMWMLDPQAGPVNQILTLFSLQPAWFNSPSEFANPFAWWSGTASLGSKDGLALMSLWGIGNFIIIYLAALENIPQELYEAAELDGAGRWQRFWHITRPHLSPVIFFNIIMGLVASVQYFTQPYVVSGGTGGPENSTRVLSLHIFLWGFKYHEAGYANAAAWTLFIVVVLLTLVVFRTSRKWVYSG